MTANQRTRLFMVGDSVCNKAGLLMALKPERSNDSMYYPRTSIETFVTNIDVDDRQVELVLTDSSGSEGSDINRGQLYNDADVIVMCFCFNSLDSLRNISKKWYPEVIKFHPKVPVILVGLKANNPTVKRQDSEKTEREIAAVQYCEVLTTNRTSVRAMFQDAARAAYTVKVSTRRRRCPIM